jgi:hypothetical protein
VISLANRPTHISKDRLAPVTYIYVFHVGKDGRLRWCNLTGLYLGKDSVGRRGLG